MITVPDLRDADPGVFTRHAQRWTYLAGRIAGRGRELADHLAALTDWQGTAGDSARANLAEQHRKLTDVAEHLGGIPPVLTSVGDRLTQVQQRLHEAIGMAEDNALHIQPDGTVRATDFAPQGGDRLAAKLTTVVRFLLREATIADEEAAAALRGLTPHATGFAPAAGGAPGTTASGAMPARGTAPAEVKRWWDSLTPQEQEAQLLAHPDQLGALDGIPAVYRDRANRVVLDTQRSALDTERAALAAKPHRSDDENHRLDDIDGKLRGLDAVTGRLNVAPSAARLQPYLLGISTDGNGRAIVAMGNPDTATNVATFVPGTGAKLATCRGDLERADTMALAARKSGSPSTSVITWVGYDAPQSIVPQAAEDRFADGAKQDLERFQDGLRATHEGAPSHNTVIGHSYGTTVVGITARDEGLNADDVVFVASPGVGVENARGLHLVGVSPDQVGQHVHATVAQHDPIRVAAGSHGPAPTGDDFGGTTFASNPGAAGPWYELGWNPSVHSQYWDPGNRALDNMGNIIAGKPTS
ncbi:alpha/beta hydrolase [Solihabitans fulvus]|uniref:Alpha/beta hydrolase n=1 Tax=Solihabitans fulvus TaxID=1892852 RepID=A0A5B2WE31_9PSEU|nr:alpha/beta hydrolase [Solihabitans fulvus]KAA2250121.1 alpha/beta hydrolase [Solihabitans fulvus]